MTIQELAVKAAAIECPFTLRHTCGELMVWMPGWNVWVNDNIGPSGWIEEVTPRHKFSFASAVHVWADVHKERYQIGSECANRQKYFAVDEVARAAGALALEYFDEIRPC